MSEENEMSDYQVRMEKIRTDIQDKMPDVSRWVRLEKHLFDINELCAVELTVFNPINNTAVVSLYLRSGLQIKSEHLAARKIWEAFTGEELPFSD